MTGNVTQRTRPTAAMVMYKYNTDLNANKLDSQDSRNDTLTHSWAAYDDFWP